MPKELELALDVLGALDTPEDAPFAQEEVISSLLANFDISMPDAHSILCVANYLYDNGLTAVST